jgi:hypothetical protein
MKSDLGGKYSIIVKLRRTLEELSYTMEEYKLKLITSMTNGIETY